MAQNKTTKKNNRIREKKKTPATQCRLYTVPSSNSNTKHLFVVRVCVFVCIIPFVSFSILFLNWTFDVSLVFHFMSFRWLCLTAAAAAAALFLLLSRLAPFCTEIRSYRFSGCYFNQLLLLHFQLFGRQNFLFLSTSSLTLSLSFECHDTTNTLRFPSSILSFVALAHSISQFQIVRQRTMYMANDTRHRRNVNTFSASPSITLFKDRSNIGWRRSKQNGVCVCASTFHCFRVYAWIVCWEFCACVLAIVFVAPFTL